MKESKKPEKYYFAYGSNLHKVGMKNRCPDSEEVMPAILTGFEMIFKSLATIEKSHVMLTQGAVYKVSERDEKRLDRYEGFPNLYTKLNVRVIGDDGNGYECFTYIMTENGVEYGPPSPYYFNTIRTGYKDWNLQDKHLVKCIERTTVKMKTDCDETQ